MTRRYIVGGVRDDDHLEELKQQVSLGLPEGTKAGDRVLFCRNDDSLSVYDIVGEHESPDGLAIEHRYDWKNRYSQGAPYPDLRELKSADDCYLTIQQSNKIGLVDIDCLYAREYEVNPNTRVAWGNESLLQHQIDNKRECARLELERHYGGLRKRVEQFQEELFDDLLDIKSLSRLLQDSYKVRGDDTTKFRAFNQYVDRTADFMRDFSHEKVIQTSRRLDDIDGLVERVEVTIDTDLRTETPRRFIEIDLDDGEPTRIVDYDRFERLISRGRSIPYWSVTPSQLPLEDEEIAYNHLTNTDSGEPPRACYMFLNRVREAIDLSEIDSNRQEELAESRAQPLNRLIVRIEHDVETDVFTPVIKHQSAREKSQEVANEKKKGVER